MNLSNPFWSDKPLSKYRKFRNWLRWPTMLEILTIGAIVYALYLDSVFVSWTLAMLAMAWGRWHEKEKEE